MIVKLRRGNGWDIFLMIDNICMFEKNNKDLPEADKDSESLIYIKGLEYGLPVRETPDEITDKIRQAALEKGFWDQKGRMDSAFNPLT